MPLLTSRIPPFKPPKDVNFSWDTFRRGLNLLLRDNEIGADEMAQADNVVLKGQGIPTRRWGLSTYFVSEATAIGGSVRGLKAFYKSNPSTTELLAVCDNGVLTKQNSGSYTEITGVSWASGNTVYMSQLSDRVYITNGQRQLSFYSSPTLVGFATIATPTSLFATQISGASGTTTKSYKVSAISNIGETLASSAYQLANQPFDLGGLGGQIKLQWSGVSTASILVGYNIYGRDSGFERFLAFVDSSSTNYIDNGAAIPKEFTFPPLSDTTAGPIASYLTRFQDRLVMANVPNAPYRIIFSGRSPNETHFDLAFGGNYLDLEPAAGDPVIQVTTFRDRVIVFKERSIWQVNLTTQQIGNFFVATPSAVLITSAHGCIAPRSVTNVGNDVYFLTRTGVHSLGYQQGYTFDVLRSNEISLKIRPFIQNLTISQMKGAVGAYYKKKYLLLFPGLDQAVVYDTERDAWLGPWNYDGNVTETFYSSDGKQHLLIGADTSTLVNETDENISTDNGIAITMTIRTKKEEFGDWSLFKNIRNVFTKFRNLSGIVNVSIVLEKRDGTVTTAKSFSVIPNTGNTGWGADIWANVIWGSTIPKSGGIDVTETIRWAKVNQIARNIQIILTTSNAADNFELLGIKTEANPVGAGVRPSKWFA